MSKTLLSKANQYFREKQYAQALTLYQELVRRVHTLEEIARFNVELINARVPELFVEQQIISDEKILPLALNAEFASQPFGPFPLVHTHQLRLLDQGAELWEAEGVDPHFVFAPQASFFKSNAWYSIEIKLVSKVKSHHGKLYFDVGRSFNEEDAIEFPIPANQKIQVVFQLEQQLKQLRFDPDDQKTQFSVARFDINEITEKQAIEAMLTAVSKQQGTPEIVEQDAVVSWEEILQTANQEDMPPIKRLVQFYRKTFNIQPEIAKYEDWIEKYELPSIPSVAVIQAEAEHMPYKPTISIVMPVYNTHKKYLKKCIESVLGQSYPYWELCIADDCSSKKHVREILEEYASKDQRIKVVFRQKNGHISAASNSALEIASGDYVALLDHDDILAKEALYFVAKQINLNPNLKIVYSDEDKVDKYGQRFQPHFKSDWNPDLFYSQNYISHLGVYKRSILQHIRGFRVGVEGSQDQDLLLRCLPFVQAEEIGHIPRVLYHWRAIEGSTAYKAGEKSYTSEAGLKALKDYFVKLDSNVNVELGMLENTYRVNWPIPQTEPLVSLLIPTRDKKEITALAVNSILQKTTYKNYEILILDNGSVEPETLDWFKQVQQQDARVKVIRYDFPFNFSAINNFGVTQAKGEVIGLVNNDIEVISPDWLTEMVSHAIRKDVGCVGAKLHYSNDTLQHAGVILGIGGVAGHSHKYFPGQSSGYFSRLKVVQNLSAVTAACLIVRREVYDAVEGLEEQNLTVAFNDVDFCLKVLKAGYRNLWTPYAELYHHESISRGLEDTPEKQARFSKEVRFMQDKWGEILLVDKCYSPNLTLDREDFGIKR